MADIEEDWRQAKDLAEKKRVQNRVAQRSYRKRMKKRVEELEEELKKYRLHQPPEGQHLGHAALRADGNEIINRNSHQPYSPRESSLLAVETGHQGPLHFEDDAFLQIDEATWRQSESHVLSDVALQLESQASHVTSVWPWHGGGEQHQGAIAKDSAARNISGPENPPAWARATVSEPQPDCREFTMNTGGPRDSAVASSTPATSTMSRPSCESRTGKDQTIEERFDHLHRCIQDAGLGNFHSVMSLFYTTDFSCGSAVSIEQRSSRQSQLPQLLASIRELSKSWTPWEAHRYEYEVLKSAETIVGSECSHPVDLQLINHDAANDDESDRKMLAQMAQAMQRNSPKLWTLIESLAHSKDGSITRPRPLDTLAIMLILKSPKPATRTQLISWVTTCLNAV